MDQGSQVGNVRSLLESTPSEFAGYLRGLGEPEYRAEQVFHWVFREGVGDFSEMTNLGKELRAQLARDFTLASTREVARSESPEGTIKLLLGMGDGATAECVMIPAPKGSPRRTVCLSTQVGCDVGCRFCASGIGGALRNLTVGDVLGQALAVKNLLASRGERLSHVVFMGMGEPLANYKVTVEAVRRLNADWGLGIGQRRITISTVGLPKQIRLLAGERLQVTLALSLHAASDSLRADLIPWARRLPLVELLDSCRFYLDETGREITLEYCLLAGVNDRPADVEDLARVASRLRAHVNLMMYNPVAGLPFVRPTRASAFEFLRGLRERGVNVHLRGEPRARGRRRLWSAAAT